MAEVDSTSHHGLTHVVDRAGRQAVTTEDTACTRTIRIVEKQPELAERLREVREDLCGERGAQFLADALKVRVETWLNYESGVTAPAHVVLKLIDVARVNPHWLLTGEGDPHDYRLSHGESVRPLFGPVASSN